MSGAHMQTHLREYYAAQTLRPEVTARLLAQATAGAESYTPRHSWRAGWQRWVRPMAAAAAIWVVLSGALYLWDAPARSGQGQDVGSTLATAIAQEITRNHHKRADIEFTAATFADLRGQMDRLDFTPVEPAYLKARGFRLLGGRYCSLQGQLAAQIKLADSAGQIHTLYETRLNETFAAALDAEVDVNGVRVRLWQEVGLLIGLASPPTR